MIYIEKLEYVCKNYLQALIPWRTLNFLSSEVWELYKSIITLRVFGYASGLWLSTTQTTSQAFSFRQHLPFRNDSLSDFTAPARLQAALAYLSFVFQWDYSCLSWFPLRSSYGVQSSLFFFDLWILKRFCCWQYLFSSYRWSRSDCL